MTCELEVLRISWHWQLVCLMFTGASLSLGCGEREMLPTDPQASISGSVTYDEKPAPADSDVVFFCKEKDVLAAGKVDSLGKFTLSAATKSKGIPAGRYQVMIRPAELPAPAIGTEEYKKWMSEKMKPAESPKEIPKQFHQFDTSGLVLNASEQKAEVSS